jgi:hypothetical protein
VLYLHEMTVSFDDRAVQMTGLFSLDCVAIGWLANEHAVHLVMVGLDGGFSLAEVSGAVRKSPSKKQAQGC